MAFHSLADRMDQNQLQDYLAKLIEKMIEKVLKNRPDLKLTPDQKKNLVVQLTKVLLQDPKFSREQVIDKNPEFLHKLTIALVIAAKLERHEDLLEKIKKLFTDKKINEKDLNNEEVLKKKLTPLEKRPLDMYKKKITEMHKCMKELDLVSSKDQMDPNIAILGLINTKHSGTLPAVVQHFVGLMFPERRDDNPFHGMAQIDQGNKPGDDPHGAHASARRNFEKFSTLAREVKTEMERPAPKAK